jgi:hypothetical protein
LSFPTGSATVQGMRASSGLNALWFHRLALPASLFVPAALLGSPSCQSPRAPNVATIAPVQLPGVPAGELRTPDAFSVYAERVERSRALFTEASRVLLHPRCANCHPSGDVPLQYQGRLHDPPVLRGPEDRGVVGMECSSCHQDRNLELARVPGAPNWHVAPLSMAWAGRDAPAVCEQIKDPARNGGKSLAQIVDHSQHDLLVAWGWAPGGEREPAPGSQAQFGALVAAWAESGAECPPPGSAPGTSPKESP